MKKTATDKFLGNRFIAALLLHALFFLCVSTEIVFFSAQDPHKTPPRVPQQKVAQYVPSYFYTGQTKRAVASVPPQKISPVRPLPESRHGLNKRSILAMSRAAIQDDFMKTASNTPKTEEPMLLIGDESKMADPFTLLLGRSLSAHFTYPRMEGTFGVRGKVYVRLTLHPEGHYSDVQIVRSSGNNNFDMAALYAVNSAPRVIGANKFLKSPRQMIVGFIFD